MEYSLVVKNLVFLYDYAIRDVLRVEISLLLLRSRRRNIQGCGDGSLAAINSPLPFILQYQSSSHYRPSNTTHPSPKPLSNNSTTSSLTRTAIQHCVLQLYQNRLEEHSLRSPLGLILTSLMDVIRVVISNICVYLSREKD